MLIRFVDVLFVPQIRDLLPVYENSFPKIKSGLPNSLEDLLQEKVDSPMGFSKILNMAFRNRGRDASKFNVSHLYELHSVHNKSSYVHLFCQPCYKCRFSFCVFHFMCCNFMNHTEDQDHKNFFI